MKFSNQYIKFLIFIALISMVSSCDLNGSGTGDFMDVSPFFMIVMFYIFYQLFGKKRDPRKAERERQRRREQQERRRRERERRRDYRREGTDFNRPRRETRTTRESYERRAERSTSRQKPERSTRRSSRKPKNNPYKKSGIEKYKEYDYNGAIEDFEKSLAVDESDVPTHWNIACAYSIMENKDKAFYHLSRAVELGFKDFEKIKTHDDLAYLRIQDEFEVFVQNNYQYKPGATLKEEKIAQNSDLLEQLNKLAELREKGLLTEEEFAVQKKRLLE